ncbi:MAG: FxsA family protein [Alphaproteobacteria bacterium]|nr:FxsA family protein [Alphaproteobacteria bacterium]
MGLILLLMFIVVPIVEIMIFIQAGDAFGLWPTVIAVVATAIIGSFLLRTQGLSLLFKAQKNMEQGVFPVKEAFDGLCLVVAGALLLTPGFLTDTIGFLLFVPFVRLGLRTYLATKMTVHHAQGAKGFSTYGEAGPRQRPNDPTVIDGEYEEINPEETAEIEAQENNPDSPWSGKG